MKQQAGGGAAAETSEMERQTGGTGAARFLQSIKRYLELPAALLVATQQ